MGYKDDSQSEPIQVSYAQKNHMNLSKQNINTKLSRQWGSLNFKEAMHHMNDVTDGLLDLRVLVKYVHETACSALTVDGKRSDYAFPANESHNEM